MFTRDRSIRNSIRRCMSRSLNSTVSLAQIHGSYRGQDAQQRTPCSEYGRRSSRACRKPSQTVQQLDPLLALENVESMDTVVSSTEAPRRFNTLVLSGFAAVALCSRSSASMACSPYSVHERAREIAIRMALGATRESVLRRILRSALILAGTGTVIGLAASLWLTRFLESLLYGVKPLDISAFVGAVLRAAGMRRVCGMAARAPGRIHRSDADSAIGIENRRVSISPANRFLMLCFSRTWLWYIGQRSPSRPNFLGPYLPVQRLHRLRERRDHYMSHEIERVLPMKLG